MVLGSVELAAATTTLVFSVDQSRTIQQIVFANDNGVAVNVKLYVVPADTTQADKHIWVPGKQMDANDTVLLLEHNFSLALGEAIWAYSDTANVSVNVIGV
jgi:hypothetical protein